MTPGKRGTAMHREPFQNQLRRSFIGYVAAILALILFLYLGGESDSWVETILDAAEPTGQALAMIDCVETLEEEHTEGMQEEAGHHHEEHGDHDDHDDHDHLGTVTEIDEHVWTSPANAAAITLYESLRQVGGLKGV